MFKTDYQWKLYIPKEAHDKVHNYVRGMLSTYFDGYTTYTTNGAWVDSNDKVITETTFVYEIVTHNSDNIPGGLHHVIEFIIENTNEQEVLYTKTPIEIFVRKRNNNV